MSFTGKKIYLAGKEKYYNADDLCDDLVDNYFPNVKKIDDKTSQNLFIMAADNIL